MRHPCLSSLERERCFIIPALPRCFQAFDSQVETEHHKQVEAAVNDSPPPSPHLLARESENKKVSTSRIPAAILAASLPSPSEDTFASSSSPFHVSATPGFQSPADVVKSNDSRHWLSVVKTPLSPKAADQTEVEDKWDDADHSVPQSEVEETRETKVVINRKDSCSCNGLSRDSAPLFHPSTAAGTLCSEFPSLSTSVPVSISRQLLPMTEAARLPFMRVGVLVGGATTSSGLHNITVGLLHFLKKYCKQGPITRMPSESGSSTRTTTPQHNSPFLPLVQLYGFPDGAIGLLKGEVVLLGDSAVDVTLLLNRGGCEALGHRSLRSLNFPGSLERAIEVLNLLQLDGLVIYADREDLLPVARLAEAAERLKCKTKVIAAVHSVGGDIFLPDFLPTTLGFDTARKTFTEFTGNIASDSVSSKKYYHFIRCGSSLLTLESALETRPTVSIIAEEAHQMNMRLSTIVNRVVDIISLRSRELGKKSGTVLLSDRLVETLPEMNVLLDELAADYAAPENQRIIELDDPQPPPTLSPESEALFRLLPKSVRLSLLTRRDNTGRPELPSIYSEILVSHLVDKELRRRDEKLEGLGFLYRTHDLCYECHCALPTDFDCCLGYGLGHAAATLISGGFNGYVACLLNLNKPVAEWTAAGVPLLSFLGVAKESFRRDSNGSPSSTPYRLCVPRRTIDLSSFAVKSYQKFRMSWKINCLYRCPGPAQFIPHVVDVKPHNLSLVLRAHYLPVQQFEALVQAELESENMKKLEEETESQTIDCLGMPKVALLNPATRKSITRKTKSQLTHLQLQRLSYVPQLPDIFHTTFILQALDVTARLCVRPEFLRSVFPLTHNLLALEVLSRTTQPLAASWLPTPHIQPSLPRTMSNVSLCGFIGSSFVVSVPGTSTFDGLANSRNLHASSPGLLDAPKSVRKHFTSQTLKGKVDGFFVSSASTPDFQRGLLMSSAASDNSNNSQARIPQPKKLDQLLPSAMATEPLNIALCFLGRPAPGAMNILWGIMKYLSQLEPPGNCYGIVHGLDGLVTGQAILMTNELFQFYKNQGGIELLCRSSEHCHSEDDMLGCLKTADALKLNGVVLAGGFATVSTAAILAEFFLHKNSNTSIVAVPVSIESGLPSVETTLGHDTTVRVFNSVIGSIMAECRSSKSWYFLRVSGRNLSHLCLECALQTHPTLVLISEEVDNKKMGLVEITNLLADVVEARAEKGMVYGVVLLSDSLLDHVPEIRMLFNEINAIFQHSNVTTVKQTANNNKRHLLPRTEEGLSLLRSRLTPWSAAVFSSLPHRIQWQIAFSKDHVDKVDLGSVDTEVLLKTLVEAELSRRKSLGLFRQKGATFACKTHFLAYQGRSALPTAFDCDLGYSLGYFSAVLVDGKKTGYLATLSNLHASVTDWTAEAIPLSSLIEIRQVQHPQRPMQGVPADIKFSLHVPALRCSLESPAYQLVKAHRLTWLFADCFCNPGPVQFDDKLAASESSTNGWQQAPRQRTTSRLFSLKLSPGANPLVPTTQLREISTLCSEIKLLCGQNAFSTVAKVAATSLQGVLDLLKTLAVPGTNNALPLDFMSQSSRSDLQVKRQDLVGLTFLEKFLTKE